MATDDASPQADLYYSESFAGQNGNSANTGNRYSDLSQYSKIYRPDLLTMYFGFFGKRRWERRLATRLGSQVDKVQLLIERPPTRTEMEAFATITSRSMYHERTGMPLGLAVGMGSFYRSLNKSGYVPTGMRTNPTALLEAIKSFWVAEPANSRLFFAVSAFKVFMWTFGISALTGTWATYEEARGTLTDPRLSNFVTDLRRQNPDEVRRRRVAAVQDKLRQAQQGRVQRQIPDGGAYAESHEQNEGSFGGSEEDAFDASPLSRQGQTPYSSRSVPDFSGRPRLYPDPATNESETGKDTGLDFFEDEDASPTAPEYRKGNSWARLNPSTSQGSSWDRIRQQNAPQNQDQFRGTEQTQDRSVPSSYTYKRQHDREQAQADFNKLLDSERNVSDDGGYKGW